MSPTSVTPATRTPLTFVPAAWSVEVRADRAYFDRLQPDDVEFPADCPPKTYALEAPEVLIGRRSASRGVEPDIDLGCEPVDSAISHRHAVLRRADDGTYTIADLESTNGTCINDGDKPIEAGVEHALCDGDRIHLGAWTTITVRAGPPERITEEAVRR